MTDKQLERQKKHLQLNRFEDETPKTPAFKERLDKIAEARRRLNEEAIAEVHAEEVEYREREFTNPKTGEFESFKERTERLKREREEVERKEWAELERLYPTQKEIRESKRKERQAELERAKLNQQDILDKCNLQGECKVNDNDLKNAFPKIVSLIDGNAFRPQINIKQFSQFLLDNSLTFSLPDCVFKKKV